MTWALPFAGNSYSVINAALAHRLGYEGLKSICYIMFVCSFVCLFVCMHTVNLNRSGHNPGVLSLGVWNRTLVTLKELIIK